MFQDRNEAGRKLASRLLKYKHENLVIVALPRGGVPIGFEVARLLEAPLDVIIVRKLGYPGQPELAIGAIANGNKWEIIMNHEGIGEMVLPPAYLEHEVAVKLNQIKTMTDMFRQHRPGIGFTKRTVILVDDGMATGATMRVVVKRVKRDQPAKIVVAVPVASREAMGLLLGEVDDVISLDVPKYFGAVGNFYRNFEPVPNEEVIELLEQAKDFPKLFKKAG